MCTVAGRWGSALPGELHGPVATASAGYECSLEPPCWGWQPWPCLKAQKSGTADLASGGVGGPAAELAEASVAQTGKNK